MDNGITLCANKTEYSPPMIFSQSLHRHIGIQMVQEVENELTSNVGHTLDAI